MGLRMKNFNILGVRWKVRLLEGRRGSRKTKIEGGNSVKGGDAWTVYQFNGGLSKKEGVVFLRGGG